VKTEFREGFEHEGERKVSKRETKIKMGAAD
jgi:hypothetical protein